MGAANCHKTIPTLLTFLSFFPTLEFFGPHDEPSGGILSLIFLQGENWVSVSGRGPPGEITGKGGGGDWQPHYRAAREKVWVSKVFFFPSMQWRENGRSGFLSGWHLFLERVRKALLHKNFTLKSCKTELLIKTFSKLNGRQIRQKYSPWKFLRSNKTHPVLRWKLEAPDQI